MFERRAKIFLLMLIVVAFIIVARAAQVQMIQRGYWSQQAKEALKQSKFIEAPRGRILDRFGKVLAEDKPCIDACIDYRALSSPADKDWVKARALERLKNRLADAWAKTPRKKRVELLETEVAAVNADLDKMWPRLAKLSGRGVDDILTMRDGIVQRVQMRQRYISYKRYQAAMNKAGHQIETARWKQWITDGVDAELAVDKFNVTTSEELEAHVVLPAIDTELQNELAKNIDQYPGLVLRPGTHRSYPFEDVACHVLGNLAHVDPHDLLENKGLDELRMYQRNDLIGRSGAEALCEPTLRGTRGQIERALGEDTILSSKDPASGQDVRLAIDVELQQQVQAALTSARLRDAEGNVVEENAVLHGAAVILDVNTNQVLALVSYPTYDLNLYDEKYAKLRDDEINDPLLNRATMSQLEPGSTVKPLCGMSGLLMGVLKVNEGIECAGVLRLDGHVMPYGRCWVESKFGEFLRARGLSGAHHPIPHPHKGHDGNPDGWLTYSDALERSCNCFFETVADRLGINRLSEGYERFGLGRATGIGIAEARGRLPRDFPVQSTVRRRITGVFGGIGQGYIAATPIQMANAVATIARGGIWMRPLLVMPNADGKNPALKTGEWQHVPDRVDLHLPADGVAAAHAGMFNVVNGSSGTGKGLAAGDEQLKRLGCAGKTGTAQAARFSIKVRDGAGKLVLDANNRPKRQFLDPSTPGNPNPIAPWYRSPDPQGKDLNHAWYIGFVPAERPKVAFAVMVEYGGSGGVAAAAVAREAIEACIRRGYLKTSESVADARPSADIEH